jgi:hypothetical protein
MPNFSSTIGDPDATSYISVLEAEEFLNALPVSQGITDWLALTNEQKEQSLNASTLALDVLNWSGATCSCEQRLQWPRRVKVECCISSCDDIPADVKLPTSYMAAFMGGAGGFLAISSTTGGSSGGGSVAGLEPFAEVTIGPIKVKMKEGTTYGDDLTSNIGQIPPFVADLIRRYLSAFGISQGSVSRRSIAMAGPGYIGSPAYSGTMYLKNGMVYPRIGGWATNGRGGC